jgi:DNA-binding response OmpR family regulator
MHPGVQTHQAVSDLIVKRAVIRLRCGPFSRMGDPLVRRVLMVDDDPMVRMAIEFCLQRQGFEVAIADGGETVLDAIEMPTFDLMLINILMLRTPGFESVRMFFERAPAIPLIAIFGCAFAKSEWPSRELLRMMLELGAVCCLRKPFTEEALLAAVRRSLTRPATTALLSP